MLVIGAECPSSRHFHCGRDGRGLREAPTVLYHSVDELLAASDGGTKEDNRLDRMLCCLQNLLGEPEFACWRDTFCKAHCGEFEKVTKAASRAWTFIASIWPSSEKRVEATLAPK